MWMALIGSLISGAGSYFGGKEAGEAGDDAGYWQFRATSKAVAAELEQFYTARADLMPWTDAGKTALNELLGRYSVLAGKYTGKDELGRPSALTSYKSDIEALTPEGYEESAYNKFLREQGMKGIQESAAGRGKLLSSQTQNALIEYNQDLARRGYSEWLDQGYKRAGSRLAPWMELAGYGGGAAGQQAANALTVGRDVANLTQQGGFAAAESRLAGTLGKWNTWAQGARNLGGNINSLYANYTQANQSGYYQPQPSGTQPNYRYLYDSAYTQ